ncbi:MAG: hypothetical protein JW818_09385 [Pirellulales bacterium]|nr:hypothetical protein [Pirellulales bacterium]
MFWLVRFSEFDRNTGWLARFSEFDRNTGGDVPPDEGGEEFDRNAGGGVLLDEGGDALRSVVGIRRRISDRVGCGADDAVLRVERVPVSRRASCRVMGTGVVDPVDCDGPRRGPTSSGVDERDELLRGAGVSNRLVDPTGDGEDADDDRLDRDGAATGAGVCRTGPVDEDRDTRSELLDECRAKLGVLRLLLERDGAAEDRAGEDDRLGSRDEVLADRVDVGRGVLVERKTAGEEDCEDDREFDPEDDDLEDDRENVGCDDREGVLETVDSRRGGGELERDGP